MDKDMDYKEFETYEEIEDFLTMGHIDPDRLNIENFINDNTDFIMQAIFNNG